MKRLITLVFVLLSVLGLVSCNSRNMNDIIANEPNITGIVEEVHDNYILIYIETDGYPSGADCKVSLRVENSDGLYGPITVGDEVVVYYDGNIAESAPLQINTVYAITLKKPAEKVGMTISTEEIENDVVLVEPPTLIVASNESRAQAWMGTYSWAYRKEDGTFGDICSDSVHPLEAKEYMSAIELSPTTSSDTEPLRARLQFITDINEVNPDDIMVHCWSGENWGQTQTKYEEVEAYTENDIWYITLKDGTYVYSIIAEWDGGARYSGTVSYSFYTVN